METAYVLVKSVMAHEMEVMHEVLKRKKIPTPEENYSEILSSIKNLINELDTDDSSIGICTPGSPSKSTNLTKNSNTQRLIGRSLKEDLEQLIDHKVVVEQLRAKVHEIKHVSYSKKQTRRFCWRFWSMRGACVRPISMLKPFPLCLFLQPCYPALP